MPLGHAWPGCLMSIHRIHIEKLRLFHFFYGLNNFTRYLFFVLLIYNVQKIWMENSCKSKRTKPIFMKYLSVMNTNWSSACGSLRRIIQTLSTIMLNFSHTRSSCTTDRIYRCINSGERKKLKIHGRTKWAYCSKMENMR